MIEYISAIVIVNLITIYLFVRFSHKDSLILKNPFLFSIPTLITAWICETLVYTTPHKLVFSVSLVLILCAAWLFHKLQAKHRKERIQHDLNIFLIGLPEHDWDLPCYADEWEKPYEQHLLSYLRTNNMSSTEFINKYKQFRDIQEIRAMLWLLEHKKINTQN